VLGRAVIKQEGSIMQMKCIRTYIPGIVVGWGPGSGNVALCARYERCCYTGFFKFLEINKIVIVASSWFFYIILPISSVLSLQTAVLLGLILSYN
jgi:hypothetical protein